MPTVRRTLILAALVAAAGGLAFATGAAVVDGPADTFAEERLAVQPAEGPNGAYAYLNDADEIVVDVSGSNPKLPSDFEGVNPGTLAAADGVFTITYTADDYARVWIDHPEENVTFVVDGESVEGRANNVTLGPDETVAVGLEVDARGAVAGTRLGGDEFDIRAEVAEPESMSSNADGEEEEADGGAATTVRRPEPDRREFEGRELSPGAGVTFDAGAMEIAGGDVTLDRVRITSENGRDVDFETVGRPDPFPSAGPLNDSRGAAPNGYFEFDHSFAGDEVSRVRFSVSVDRDYLNETGGDPDDISLYRRSESASGGWERLETERVDPAVRRLLDLPEDRVHVTAPTDEFTVFAVATDRARIRATDASLDREAVDAGESAVVRATVANEGRDDGARDVTLTADGEPLATQRVELDPGESAAVAFEPAFDDPGEYDIAVDDASAGTLAVGDPAGDGDEDDTASVEGGTDDGGTAAPDGDASDPPTEEPSGIGPSNLVGLAVFLAIALASVALVRRMPRS
ncbi:CARDB domain-containing protein [Halorubrum trapanicum]|uniref:CARDB domain-containing protein n=1 Tax=Halorubrum trapanicum TaxID=29284 RepID=UPI003C704461